MEYNRENCPTLAALLAVADDMVALPVEGPLYLQLIHSFKEQLLATEVMVNATVSLAHMFGREGLQQAPERLRAKHAMIVDALRFQIALATAAMVEQLTDPAAPTIDTTALEVELRTYLAHMKDRVVAEAMNQKGDA